MCLPLLFGLAVCDTPTEETPPSDMYASIAFIHGAVRGPSGEPVDSVRVNALIIGRGDDCMPPSRGPTEVEVGIAWTDSAGHYAELMQFLHFSEFPGCLAVDFQPPPASGLDSVRVDGIRATFRHELNTPPVDTVQVNATLPPAS